MSLYKKVVSTRRRDSIRIMERETVETVGRMSNPQSYCAGCSHENLHELLVEGPELTAGAASEVSRPRLQEKSMVVYRGELTLSHGCQV
jgi:hypothetical protein